MPSHLKVVDLFCGCGGISWGFKTAGFYIVAGVDCKAIPLATFRRNHPGALSVEADLSQLRPQDLAHRLKLRAGELDVLVGGPPCQGFSKNVPARQRFSDDPRNRLILAFLEFVKTLRPRVVLIENVAEMMNAYEEGYTEEILGSLKALGYNATKARLLAADYGVPQLRRRAFFFAARTGAPLPIPSPSRLGPKRSPGLFSQHLAAGYVTAWEAIGDLPSLSAGEGKSPMEYTQEPSTGYARLMRNGSSLLHDHVARALTRPQLERVMHLEPGSGQGARALPKHLRPRSGYSGAYARLIPAEPARTITRWVFHPGSGRYYHPFEDRVITIREAARLQSFPDRFVFEGTYIQKSHQVGEAVPPLLAQAFAEEARRLLLGERAPHLFDEVREAGSPPL